MRLDRKPGDFFGHGVRIGALSVSGHFENFGVGRHGIDLRTRPLAGRSTIRQPGGCPAPQRPFGRHELAGTESPDPPQPHRRDNDKGQTNEYEWHREYPVEQRVLDGKNEHTGSCEHQSEQHSDEVRRDLVSAIGQDVAVDRLFGVWWAVRVDLHCAIVEAVASRPLPTVAKRPACV